MAATEGWNLRDRGFVTALVVSLLWHLFWFFSLSIVINPHKRLSKKRPQIVSLGPVLDDAIFRTLVETRAEVSQTFYRRLSDFKSPADLEVRTMARPTAGSVVSVPMERKAQESMRQLVGGAKAVPGYSLSPPQSSETPDPDEEERKRRQREASGL